MFVIGVLALFVPGSPGAQIFDIGGGTKVVVAPDLTSQLQDGSLVEIWKAGNALAKMTTRKLIEGWLPSDSFWGGHAAANEMRYEDHPIPDANRMLQGRVYEVVPAPGGCLLRIGLINTAPSLVLVEQDIVLRWRSSAPNQWPVIDRSMDGISDSVKTIKLPRLRGVQFLVTTQAVYRLSGPNLKRTLVANLPKPTDEGFWGWVGTKLTGSTLSLALPNRDTPTRLQLNLLAGKVTR